MGGFSQLEIADLGIYSIIGQDCLLLTLLLLCNTSTRTTALSRSKNVSVVRIIHRRWRCWVSRWAIRPMSHLLLLISSTLCNRCLRTIRTFICLIRLLTAVWRWWFCILSGSAPAQMATLHKLVVIDHPKRTEVIFVPNEAFMKRQIGSDGVLILDRPEKQIQVTHEGISTFLSY